MSEVLALLLNDVLPDPNQPRQHFDQTAMSELCIAMRRWGQLSPIWVRQSEGKAVIVNGERRWRALQELQRQFPKEERFWRIKAIEVEEHQFSSHDLRAAQLVVNSTAEDLTPTEKASVIRELKGKDGSRTSDACLQEQFGISKGQLRHARALADAPPFIQAFGLPQSYEVRGKTSGGAEKPRRVDAPPLGMSLLAELITLYNKLHAFDAKSFRETKGTHRVVAEAETSKLGALAQRDNWSKSQLKARCESSYRKHTCESSEKQVSSAPLNSAVERLHMAVEKAFSSSENDAELLDLAATLRALISRIEKQAPRLGDATA